MKQIAAAANALADQATAVSEAETVTPEVVDVVRRAFLTLNAACKVLKRTKKK